MLIILVALLVFAEAQLSAIEWAGINWTIKDTAGKLQSPGPNIWAKENVRVDNNGYLHLMIQKINQSWTASEIWTPTTFNYGRFTWEITGPLASMSENLVFGVFLYSSNKTMGPDGTN